MVYWCWCQRRKRMLVRQFVRHTQLAPLLTFAPWPNGCLDVWPVCNLFHSIHLPSVLSKFGYKIKKSQLRPSVRLDAPVWPNVKIAVCDAIWFFLDWYRRSRWRWRQQVLPKRWNGYYQTTRVGTLIVATIYLQLIQNRCLFRSFTVLQCSHQHCVQPVASDVEVVGYL